MDVIDRLLLFVHPVPYEAAEVERYMALWSLFLREQAKSGGTALCLLSNEARGMEGLEELARECFGPRCIVDPTDAGSETMRLVGEDLTRTLDQRGSRTEWIPYEIWTSNNARMWCEGLRGELAARALCYDTATLQVTACGQQWQGCLTKYALFMATYLGLSRPAEVKPDLSPGAGFPLEATWKESHLLPHHVWLHLFETKDGRPMAQFTDGLRGVWEAPHMATVAIPSEDVELVSWSPNAYIQANGAAANFPDSVVMDVGDGCHGDYSTLVAKRIGFPAFRDVLLAARVEDLPRKTGVYHGIPYLMPARMSPDRGR